MTEIVKIDLMQVVDAAEVIKDTCDIQEVSGKKLRGSFEFSGELILVFQD